jgi:heptosyltransferase III
MKILCIQLRQLGDVIMTTPAVRQLRLLQPDAEIVFMTEPPGSQVYRNNPHVDRVWTVPARPGIRSMLRLFRAVRAERFDLVIDFFSNPRSAQLTWASRAASRLGFDFRGRTYAYTRKVGLPEPGEYAARSKNRLIQSLGGDLDDVATLLPRDSEAEAQARDFCAQHEFGTNTVAFGVVQRRQHRLLPSAFYAAVGAGLVKEGYRLFFIYGPGEEDMAEAVRSLLPHQAAAVIGYDVPSIMTTCAVLRHCVMFVGNDGGSKHLSVCAGIPTVAFFRGGRAGNWTPPGHAAFQFEDGVTSEAVLRCCQERLLDGSRRPGAAAPAEPT